MTRIRMLAVAAAGLLVLGACSSDGSGEDRFTDDSVVQSDAPSPDQTEDLEAAAGNGGVAPAPADDEAIMPDVVCMDLQSAQDSIQEAGVFFSRSNDATGDDRMQLVDSNWLVVGQTPAAGTPIGELEAVLDVVGWCRVGRRRRRWRRR